MVLQVFTHTGQGRDDLNAMPGKQVRVASAGLFQDLRRVNGSPGDDIFLAGFCCFGLALLGLGNASRLFAFKQDPGGQRMGGDGQVCSLLGWVQISHSRRTASSILHGQLIVGDSFLVLAI